MNRIDPGVIGKMNEILFKARVLFREKKKSVIKPLAGTAWEFRFPFSGGRKTHSMTRWKMAFESALLSFMYAYLHFSTNQESFNKMIGG